MTNNQMMEEFKNYLVTSMNEDVYYQLKSWLNQFDFDEDFEYREALDYISQNLNGSLQWVD